MTEEDESGVAVQDLAYVGLDALRAMVPLDLCAYLHISPALGSQLYLRAPDLSTLDATSAFDLFTALRDALSTAVPGSQRMQVASFEALAVLTAGEISRGLFVLGRRDGALTDEEEGLASGLCRAVGIAAHAVEASGRPAVESGPLKVTVEVKDGAAHAVVVLPLSGDLRMGRGDGPSPIDAVARATLEALDTRLKLVSITEGDVAGERVVIAIVRNNLDQSAPGAAIAGMDALHAAAVATADAAAKLRP